jgi:hypothetical protein
MKKKLLLIAIGIVLSVQTIVAQVPSTPGFITVSTNNICRGSVVQFSVGSVLQASSYQWTFPDNSYTISGGGGSTSNTISVVFMGGAIISGNVTVKACNSFGCSSVSSRPITISATPSINSIVGPTSICVGGSMANYSVGATNVNSFIWTLPPNFTFQGSSTGSSVVVKSPIGASSPGNINVSSTNSCGTVSRSLTVSTISRPPSPSAISGPSIVCQGQSNVQFSTPNNNIPPGTNCFWTLPNGVSHAAGSNPLGNIILLNFSSNAVSGDISVQWNNQFCLGNSSSLAVTVGDPVPATPTISTSGSTTFCQGNSVILTSSSSTGNTWSNGATTQSITVTNGGSYNVAVSNGICSTISASTVVTVNPSSAVILSPINNYIDINSSPVQLNGTPNGGTFSGLGVVGSIFYPATAGLGNNTVTYNFSNNFGCSSSDNQSIIVYDIIGSSCSNMTISIPILGINPPNNMNTITVYPNPANTNITIDFGNFTIMNGFTVKINNSLGQQVYTAPINQQSSNIDLTTLSGAGIYYLSVIDTLGNTLAIRKILLQ